MEIWDLYDKEGKRTGKTWERQFGNYRQIPDGYYHMVVDILVQHTDGTYLLTKRDMSKDVYPGYWEASAGGSAIAGEEPFEAARRELFEETGLTAFRMELVSHTFRDPSHSMFYSFLATVDAAKDSLVLQEGETVDYKWVDDRGFINYVESDQAIKTHNDRYKDLIERIKKRLNNSFAEALLSEKTDKIPDEYDWFAPLIGDWDCDYYDVWDGEKRHVKGEWIFRRILEGTGIQDIFIFPSRSTKEISPQPDGEYGTSLRMYNREKNCYDVVYTCDHVMKRLCFTKDGDSLKGKVLDEERTYWVFSDITGDSFRWQYVMYKEDGSKELVCEVEGKRILETLL